METNAHGNPKNIISIQTKNEIGMRITKQSKKKKKQHIIIRLKKKKTLRKTNDWDYAAKQNRTKKICNRM